MMMVLHPVRRAAPEENAGQDARRLHKRFETDIEGKLLLENGDLSVRIRDISLGGAGISLDPGFQELPREIVLHTLELGSYRGEIKWRRHGEAGMAFRFAGGPPLKLRTFVAERSYRRH